MFEPISVFLILAVAAYLLQTAFILFGTRRLNYRKTRNLPAVSVLVALRDEEATLAACVESLVRLDYPAELLEIILINDRSRDKTAEMIEDFKQKFPALKTCHIAECLPGLSGKANAIARGIQLASGELVLVTDGDCRVPPGWVRAHAAYYTEDVGLVGGFTLLDQKNDATPVFGRIQSLDWAYLLSVGAGAMGFGLPLSVLGNNFSFRRQAYDEVGGYRNIGFTIIEDFALMKTLLKRTDWNVLYPIDPRMLVISKSMPGLRSFYRQRKRWSAGGKEVGLYGKALMFISAIVHLLIPAAFFMALPLWLPVSALGLVLLTDFGLLLRTTGLVQRRDLLRYFPVWELFYFVYTALFAPVLLFPTSVTWKNTSYKWNFHWQLKKMFENS